MCHWLGKPGQENLDLYNELSMSVEVLNISLSIAVILIAVSFAYAAYQFVQTLKPLRNIAQRVDDATRGLRFV